LKDRLDEAWLSVRTGVIRYVSIGFRSIGDVGQLAGGGKLFKAVEILELSLVSVAANQEAQIGVVKSPMARIAA
jgi:uncharacterized protein